MTTRRSKASSRTAAFDRLDRPVRAWLKDDFSLLQDGDAILFLMDGFEADFRKWWWVHRPGEEFQHPYSWWKERD